MGFLLCTVTAGVATVAVVGWLEANPIKIKDIWQAVVSRLPQLTE
jgi:hypothetical protein